MDRNTWVVSLALCLLVLHCSAQDSTPTDNDEELSNCRKDLGMFTGEIEDSALSSSSSFNHRTTGPHNARIRTEKNGGAWCPEPMINKDAYEWLQIDLQNLTVISHVETQGRFGNGQISLVDSWPIVTMTSAWAVALHSMFIYLM